MPKVKTKRGAAKRFRITRRNKVMFRHAYHSHLLRRKRPARKRRLGRVDVLATGETGKIFHMLPYR